MATFAPAFPLLYTTASTQVSNIVYQWPTITTGSVTAGNSLFNPFNPWYHVMTGGDIIGSSVVYNQIYRWNDPTTAYVYQGPYVYQGQHFDETPEQRHTREMQLVEWQDAQDKAAKRAEELLLFALPDKLKEQYLKHGYFETELNDRVYRIKKGTGVKLIEGGKEKASFCIHPTEYLPAPDTMLAQFLMLRSNEERFLKTANKTILF